MLISCNELIWGSVDQTKDVYNFMELKGRADAAQATGMESKGELIPWSYTEVLHSEEPGTVRQSQKTTQEWVNQINVSQHLFFNRQPRTFYKTFFKGVYFESHHKVIFPHFVI